jgi:hypothetical protein
MSSVRQRILEENLTAPIHFLDERREVWQRLNIAMFGKYSIQDFVQFFLSLLLRLRIAHHRQEECPKS